MCGGIGFGYKRIPYEELKRYFSNQEIKKFESQERINTFFWSPHPVLPVENGNQIKLLDWGNRDKNIDLPQTGWAKQESLDKGKWDYLHPRTIKIPAQFGYEKGIWFEIKNGISGIKINKNNLSRVYMITKQASNKYLKLTGHYREPVLL